MNLQEQYSKQYQWRDWMKVYKFLPDLRGARILDLGCAIGDQAKYFSERGAIVIGVDNNEGLLNVARSRNIKNCTFINSDLTSLCQLSNESFDILWSSFSVAYFSNQVEILSYWKQFLKIEGLLIVVEMSDLLNHEPMLLQYQEAIKKFYSDALTTGRYDFLAGNKLVTSMNNLNFNIKKVIDLGDEELRFNGVATSEVYKAWENRFDRMKGLQKDLGNDFISHFLSILQSEQHRSNCAVKCVIATKKRNEKLANEGVAQINNYRNKKEK